MRTLFVYTILARSLILVSCAATLSCTAHAQRAMPTGVRAHDILQAASVPSAMRAGTQPDDARPSAYEMPVRVAMGTGGVVAGVFAGALVGASLPRSPCNCEDPGLAEALSGALVGSVVLSAVIASAPQFSSNCSQLRRLGYGLVGALAGGFAGGALGATTGSGGMLLGYFAGSGVGAGVGSGMCR